MQPKKPKPLTKAELRIMEVLWETRQATVADVVASIRKPPLAYTTVLTMLRILEEKGIVSHVADGRAHVYSPRIEREEAAQSALGDLLGSFFSDSKTALAMRLIAEERPSEDELASIKALIARYEEENR
jgi:BlaI family transcriptional regulator, penicillinase repressor